MNLKTLTREWYTRLRESGFQDIEYLDRANGSEFSRTRGSLARDYARDSKRHKESTAEYYRIAGWFLHDYSFRKARDRDIWALYADGQTIREIRMLTGWGVGTVHRVIKALESGPFDRYRAIIEALNVIE